MKNFKGSADIVDIAAPEDADSGEFLIVGQLYGVAGKAALSGETVAIHRRGIFSPLPKETGATWSVGDQLYWNASTKVFSKDNTDTLVRAVAGAAAGSGDTTGTVILFG